MVEADAILPVIVQQQLARVGEDAPPAIIKIDARPAVFKTTGYVAIKAGQIVQLEVVDLRKIIMMLVTYHLSCTGFHGDKTIIHVNILIWAGFQQYLTGIEVVEHRWMIAVTTDHGPVAV